ncbi:MAG TPA: response regulator transcription factor [Caldimonas sp.]|nr:response regulator transcription factor [Caldimonas sp.]
MKVLLIDDHPLILSALEVVVRRLAQDVSVTCAPNAALAREALAASPDFDLALLDLQLGDDDGFALLAELRAAYPAVPIVIVSASDRRAQVLRAIDLGAMGFVCKCAGNDTLLKALEMVVSGGIYLPPTIMRSAASADEDASHRLLDSTSRGMTAPRGEDTDAVIARLGLTRRQSEVLSLLLRGQSNKLIARALNLSVETIKDHVAAVLRALKVSSRTQAVLVVSEMSLAGGGWRHGQSAAGVRSEALSEAIPSRPSS